MLFHFCHFVVAFGTSSFKMVYKRNNEECNKAKAKYGNDEFLAVVPFVKRIGFVFSKIAGLITVVVLVQIFAVFARNQTVLSLLFPLITRVSLQTRNIARRLIDQIAEIISAVKV